jgi:hypothetical protein
MMRAMLILAVVVSCGVATAAAARAEEWAPGVHRDNLAAWINGPGKVAGRQEVESQIAALKRVTVAAEKGRIDPKLQTYKEIRGKNGGYIINFPSREAKAKHLENAKALLASLQAKSNDPPVAFPEMSCHKLEVGLIGKLRWSRKSPDGEECEVVQVVDESNCIIAMGPVRGDSRIWIWRESPTKGLVDGKQYLFGDTIYEVIGTKTYKTAIGGSKTIFHVVPRTADELVKSAKP